MLATPGWQEMSAAPVLVLLGGVKVGRGQVTQGCQLWGEEPLVYFLCAHLSPPHPGDLKGSLQPRLPTKLPSPPSGSSYKSGVGQKEAFLLFS